MDYYWTKLIKSCIKLADVADLIFKILTTALQNGTAHHINRPKSTTAGPMINKFAGYVLIKYLKLTLTVSSKSTTWGRNKIKNITISGGYL